MPDDPPEIDTCLRCNREVWIWTTDFPLKSECQRQDCPYRRIGEFDEPLDHFLSVEFIETSGVEPGSCQPAIPKIRESSRLQRRETSDVGLTASPARHSGREKEPRRR